MADDNVAVAVRVSRLNCFDELFLFINLLQLNEQLSSHPHALFLSLSCIFILELVV